MKTLETRIRINGSADEVWSVLVDFDKYPEWNPFILHLKGATDIGNQIEVSLKMEGSNPQTFKPAVLVNKKKEEFRWKGKLFVEGLFDGEHYFGLTRISEKETEFIHGEIFSGVLVAPVMSLIGEKTKAGFEAMNVTLKNRVESNSPKS